MALLVMRTLQFPVLAYSRVQSFRSCFPHCPWALNASFQPLETDGLCSAQLLSHHLPFLLNFKLLSCFKAFQLPLFRLLAFQLPWEKLQSWQLRIGSCLQGRSISKCLKFPSLWDGGLSDSHCFGSSSMPSKRFKKIYPSFFVVVLGGTIGLPQVLFLFLLGRSTLGMFFLRLLIKLVELLWGGIFISGVPVCQNYFHFY